MNTNDPEPRMRAIVAEIVRRDVSKIPSDADLVEQLGLDSLQGLQMLAALEKRFSVRFPDDRLSKLRTFQSLVDAIRQATKETPR